MTSLGALLRAKRKSWTFACVNCGTSFVASDARAKYCSNRCQQAAKYARKTGKTKIFESS